MFCANKLFFLQRMRVQSHAYAELNDTIAIHSTNEHFSLIAYVGIYWHTPEKNTYS